MVLNNPTLLESLSSWEQKIINPIIQKEIVEIKNNSSKSQYQNIDSILDLLLNMFSVTASESKHNEKDKKKHKRKKGRAI